MSECRSLSDHPDIGLIDERLLPPVARQLVRVIGMAETIVLLQKRGGIPTRMPTAAEADHEVLGTILSADAIAALTDSELAGKRLELPKADKALQQLRNLAIAEARRTHTAPQVAQMFDLTRRRVIMIHKEVQQDDDQGDLFACGPAE